MSKKRSKTSEIDTSEIVDEWQKLKKDLKINHRKDLTPKQIDFMKLAMDPDTKMIFVRGPAGTTKSYLAVYAALQLIARKRVNEILYVRTVIESSSRSIGFLSGQLSEKFQPYMTPLLDKLDELVPRDDVAYLMQEGIINSTPINFLRGASLRDTVVIGEEAQNFDFKELTTLLTRIEKGSKAFIIGDPMQSDIGGRSGFNKVYEAFDNEDGQDNGIFCFEFSQEDILRSELVKYIVGVLDSVRVNDLIKRKSTANPRPDYRNGVDWVPTVSNL